MATVELNFEPPNCGDHSIIETIEGVLKRQRVRSLARPPSIVLRDEVVDGGVGGAGWCL